MLKKTIYLLFISIYLVFSFLEKSNADFVFNKPYITNEEFNTCNKIYLYAIENGMHTKPISNVITSIGLQFIDTPYNSTPSQKNEKKQILIRVSSFDCVTYLETMVALSRCIKKRTYQKNDFIDELIFVRYRGGVYDTYPSILVYFSDWINDNLEKGTIKDVTKEIGGEPVKFSIGKNNGTEPKDEEKQQVYFSYSAIIKKQESFINNRLFYYIPKDRIEEIEHKIQNGDIIAITSKADGMDISHVVFAHRKHDKKIYVLHASSTSKRVLLTKDTLYDYTKTKPDHTGIIVLRIQDVK